MRELSLLPNASLASSARPITEEENRLADYTCSLTAAAIVTLAFAVIAPECQHWFVIPVIACGGLCCAAVIPWIRGKVDLLEPSALVHMLGLHLFFLAPLLVIALGYETPYVDPPDDWRPWVGGMAVLNFLGLIAFRLAYQYCLSKVTPASSLGWTLQEQRFVTISSISIVALTLLQCLVYVRTGGIGGFIQKFTEASEDFSGYGAVFMFSESVPILTMFLMALWARKRKQRQTLIILGAMLTTFILLKVFFGGFRGSRGHIIYGLFWATAIVHSIVRPLPKRFIFAGVLFGLAFVYLYGFYKTYGGEAIRALTGAPDAQAQLLEEPSRRVEGVLLGDLSRCDIQAQILYRLYDQPSWDYEYKYGKTYLGTLALLVPRTIIGERPPSKVKAGTELLFGPNVYESGFLSTFAFGIPGEAMLNFGLLGGVLSCAVIGLYAALMYRWTASMHSHDSRLLVAPLLASLAFMALLWDSDVLLFYTVKEGFVPMLLLWVCSQRVVIP